FQLATVAARRGLRVQEDGRMLMRISIIYAPRANQARLLMAARKPEIDWKTVGRRIRQLRGFDLTQAAFARQIGISQSQLSRYEKGKSEIGADVLLRFAEQCGRSVEWLLTGKE